MCTNTVSTLDQFKLFPISTDLYLLFMHLHTISTNNLKKIYSINKIIQNSLICHNVVMYSKVILRLIGKKRMKVSKLRIGYTSENKDIFTSWDSLIALFISRCSCIRIDDDESQIYSNENTLIYPLSPTLTTINFCLNPLYAI